MLSTIGTLFLGTVLSGASTSGGNHVPVPWSRGRVELASVGALAFGPDGILFAADPLAAELFAIDTGEKAGKVTAPALEGVTSKVAALLGTTAKDVTIQDLAVHPATGTAYLAVQRGSGLDAWPAILRVSGEGELEELPMEDLRHMSVRLTDAPDEPDGSSRRQRNQRLESITDLRFLDGKVLIAGLSNEEFASKLRSVTFPFAMDGEVPAGASVEIYHGAHGSWETRAPVRTFVPFEIGGEEHLLAAYTCTPLVKFSMDVFGSEEKVVGTTVAELGSGNVPLDMESYARDGARYLLITNSRRGVMKVSTEGVEGSEGITDPVGGGATAGLTYETVEYLQGVEQMAKLDDDSFVLLMKERDAKEPRLVTVEAP